MARSLLRRRGHLAFCHYERSINCHRERSAAIYWQGDYHAVHAARLAMTRFSGKNRTTSSIAMTKVVRNDKNRAQ